MNIEWLVTSVINGAVAIGTLYLVYITYKQIKENNARIHMADLRELVNNWLNFLPNVQRAESTEYSHDNFSIYEHGSLSLNSPLDKKYVPPLFSIENHALFEDIFHHFPNLKDSWNKKAIKDYDDTRKRLIEKIDEDVKHKKIYSGINFNIRKGFPLSVYTEIICLTKGENSGYNYETIYMNATPVDKRVNLNYSLGEHACPLAEMENDKIEDVKKIHIDIIKECKIKYDDDIKKIIEMEKKLINNRKELISTLENITHYIIPPKPDCKYIKS